MLKIASKSFAFSDRIACPVIALAGLCVYLAAFGHDFQTFWDDQWVAVNGYTEAGLAYSNAKRILSEFYHGQYAPVNQLYYSTRYHFFGYDAFVFHAGSVFFHILNAILVYFFIKRISGALAWLKGKAWLVSVATAVLFVAHPVAVESVAWIAA